MKYKTFRALLLGGVVAAGAGGVALFAGRAKHEPPVAAAPVAALPPEPVPVPVPVAAPAPAPAEPGALRPMDEEILAAARRGIAGDKAKDAVPGRPWKVNLYKDAGQSGVNRLKVDLDRDDRWDEKWTFQPDGSVERQVSPTDDDATYTETFILRDGRWQGAGQAPAAAPVATPAGALRAMDQEILLLLERPAQVEKVKDAFPGQAYKVNLYRDAGFASWNRAKIDLDRDEKDDEKWTIEGTGAGRKVKRQVSPADDGQYPEEYRLVGGAWVKK